MNDGELLLHNILDNPADDVVRLVYADWLEEQGDAKRAAAIRWFIANPDYYQFVPITEFVPSLTEFKFSGEVCGVWHRGFGREVRMRCADFMTHAGAIFREHPVERVVLTDREPQPQHTGRCGWMNYYEVFDDPVYFSGGHAPRFENYALPRELYLLLRGDSDVIENSNNCWAMYRTREDCVSALSTACVTYGRQLALASRSGPTPT